MSMMIEDGKGTGSRLAVSAENRARTESVTHSPQMHASFVYQKAYQAISGVQTVSSPDAYGILALTNTGAEDIAVTYIRMGVDKAEVSQVKAEVLLGGVWAAGTAASIVNMNTVSSLQPEVTAHYNSIPTGSPSVIDVRWATGPAEMTYNKEGAIIIPTGGIIALRMTTETASVSIHGRISFFVIPAALSAAM
jgi:hypothetical protein